ncbi:DUF262 domain-containing protein [Cytobacillus gottheilii]|uniref:DUF262 domain-containing protein n=1 Tax=Cytobacillus gottheilii TaxID=859144 RepID=UPI00083300C7|nr:DUF262 domain-containing protein [Cytobacillus gottheilii]
MRIIEKISNENRTVKNLVDDRRSGNLIVDQSFQRNYVWGPKDQVKLIETILLGYSIPEIYLYNQTVNPDTGDMTTSIIDGQQRIGAVYDYINDEFSLNARYLSNSSSSYANKMFSELTVEEKKIIWSYPFTARVINFNIEREYIVELFLRLNATDKTLNPQELRNAEFNGEFIKQAEKISNFNFWKEIFSSSRIRRMADIEFISQILIYFRFGIDSDLNQTAINKAYDTFNEIYEKKDEDFNRFKAIIYVLEELSKSKVILDFMKKVTHLYTIIIVVDYLTNIKNINILQESVMLKNIEEFSYYVIGDERHKDNAVLNEYLELSLEGTRRKSNRLRRINLMKKFVLEGF